MYKGYAKARVEAVGDPMVLRTIYNWENQSPARSLLGSLLGAYQEAFRILIP